LDRFVEATGAIVSEEKTKVFLIGLEDPQLWLNRKWKLIKLREIIWYLGICLGVQTSFVDHWWWIMAKFEKKLHAWSHLDLPLVGKFTIVDIVISQSSICAKPSHDA
jgi:hypothetical protein